VSVSVSQVVTHYSQCQLVLVRWWHITVSVS